MLTYLALPCKSSHHSNNSWNLNWFLIIYNSLVYSAEIESGNCVFSDFYKVYDFSPVEYLREHRSTFFDRLATDLKQSPSLFLKLLADDEATCRYPDDGKVLNACAKTQQWYTFIKMFTSLYETCCQAHTSFFLLGPSHHQSAGHHSFRLHFNDLPIHCFSVLPKCLLPFIVQLCSQVFTLMLCTGTVPWEKYRYNTILLILLKIHTF